MARINWLAFLNFIELKKQFKKNILSLFVKLNIY